MLLSKSFKLMHERQLVLEVEQVAHGESQLEQVPLLLYFPLGQESTHVLPSKTFELMHDRQLVLEVEQVAHGEVQLSRIFPIICTVKLIVPILFFYLTFVPFIKL